jgi:peptidyl-tRNA hydrolase
MSTLGIGTFEVGEDVRKYIFDKLTQTPDEWKQFILERAIEKFRQLKKAISEARENGEQIDETNPFVQKTRDDFEQLLRIRQK